MDKVVLEIINSVLSEEELLPEKTNTSLSAVLKDVEMLLPQLADLIQKGATKEAMNVLQLVATKIENIRIESRK